MTEAIERIGGLDTARVTSGANSRLSVVMLHGYAMRAEDLVPFARSMGVAAEYYFPEAPLDAVPTGSAWWPVDAEHRAQALAVGARDLFESHPAGADAARRQLSALVAAVRARHPGRPLALVGFSQGGMLACDALLRGEVRAEALAMLSSSRISADDWEPRLDALVGLPVLVSHGEQDPDLAFTAGEALRDLCIRAGAHVTWLPFAGGHEVPLVVWRGVRRFLRSL